METLDPADLYEQRVLVFMETDALTNKYNQVVLNKDQYKKLTDVIIIDRKKDPELRDDFEMAELQLSEEEYDLPDLKSTE